MKSYPTIQAEKGGFSEWIKPTMKNYQMSCCDCHLVHTIDFQVVKQGKILKKYKDGNHDYEGSIVDDPKYQVRIRVKRNNRATGQLRRHRKKDL